LDFDTIVLISTSFLFLATSRGVHVYSTTESLLVRTLPIQDVVSFALSLSNSSFLYVVTSSSEIVLFDWTTGEELKKSFFTLPVSAVAIAQLAATKQDMLFAIQSEDSEDGLRDHITVQNISSTSVRLFFVSMQTLRHLKVLDNGRTIIAASETQLCIGTLNGEPLDASTELADLPSRYVWRTLKTTEPVTCLDAQLRSLSSKKQRVIVDLVFGNAKGEVIVYEDILYKLEENEKFKVKDLGLKPVINHWHREAPATVKWSLDGTNLAIFWRTWLTKDRQLSHIRRQGDCAVSMAARDFQASTPSSLDLCDRIPLCLS
jgi:NET1-associated nuclear protein 1 (U3 small nucleolar RNA-associated protein 17)